MSRCGSRISRRSTPSIPTARARPPRHRPNAGRRASRSAARRRARHHQGQYRHQGRAGAAGRRQHAAGPGGAGCAAGRALARSGRGDLFKNHHAGLRHAVVGPFQLPSPHPQSLGPQPRIPAAPVPAPAPRRGRLRPAASRHRYRRLGPAAGLLVRPGRAEAEPRASSGRSALCRPRRRTDDPHRR